MLIKSSLAPLIDFLMQTLAGRFHIDVERPENDTSQGFSEVRKRGFGGKVHVESMLSKCFELEQQRVKYQDSGL